MKYGGSTSFISKIIIHENYDKNSQDNDIALLQIKSPIDEKSIQSLPSSAEQALAPPGAAATVIGWGDTDIDSSSASFPEDLLEVTVPIVNQQICEDRFKALNYTFTNNMICAGYKVGGKDSCQGDSGGPLIVSDLSGGYFQAGIVSWGIGCAAPENYGVYTRLANYSGWINDNAVAPACTTQDIASNKC